MRRLLAVLALGAGCDNGFLTQQGYEPAQPIAFSHALHSGQFQINCEYCHFGAAQSRHSGVPPAQLCLGCHSQVKKDAPDIVALTKAVAENRPIEWVRVHRLADYVYFNHSIHVNKGVGCSSCHGQVNQMPLVFQVSSLQMEWCLDCHRNPENVLRPKDQVFNMNWQAPANQAEIGKKLAEENKIRTTAELTSCSTCHR